TKYKLRLDRGESALEHGKLHDPVGHSRANASIEDRSEEAILPETLRPASIDSPDLPTGHAPVPQPDRQVLRLVGFVQGPRNLPRKRRQCLGVQARVNEPLRNHSRVHDYPRMLYTGNRCQKPA